jgi:hypothetical protein
VSRRSFTRVGGGLLVLTLFCVGWAVADDDPIFDPSEPPVRLKKKGKQNRDAAKDKKPDQKPKDDADPEDDPEKKAGDKEPEDKKPAPPDEDREKLVKRVLKNLDEAEQRLAKNDPGSATRQIQRDIVKDLDSLIEQTRRQPPPQGGRRSRQSNQQKNNQKKNQNNNQKNNDNANNNSGNPKQKKKGSEGNSSKNTKNNNGKGKKNNPNKKRGPGGGDGKDKKDKNNLADLFKDIWGHLPMTLRQEMDAYTRMRFVPKYDALLKEYYRSISEQGRHK